MTSRTEAAETLPPSTSSSGTSSPGAPPAVSNSGNGGSGGKLFRMEAVTEQKAMWLGTVLLAPRASHNAMAIFALADLQHERNIQRKLPEQRCGGSRAPVCTGRRLASKHSFELFLQLPDLRVRGACRSGRSQSHGSLQSVRYRRSVRRRGALTPGSADRVGQKWSKH